MEFNNREERKYNQRKENNQIRILDSIKNIPNIVNQPYSNKIKNKTKIFFKNKGERDISRESGKKFMTCRCSPSQKEIIMVRNSETQKEMMSKINQFIKKRDINWIT